MKMFRWSNVSLVFLQTRVVFVQGIPQNATEDTVLNYFENSRRSGGGAVEEVKIKGNVARVQFESSEGNSTACVTGSFVCVRATKASPRGGWNQRRWWHFCSSRAPAAHHSVHFSVYNYLRISTYLLS